MKYAAARSIIADGDVLLFRSSGIVSALIRWATRSPYSHAGLAAWWGDDLMLLESREFRGCRAVRLSNALRSGAHIDLFKLVPWWPVPDDARQKVVAAARDRLGQSYGWRSILLDAAGRLPVLAGLQALGVLRKVPLLGRLLDLVPWGRAYSTEDLEDPGTRVKCSTFVAWCWRHAGLDMVPHLADRSTDPGDLARSAILVRACVLEP